MREDAPAELTDITSKFQPKARESIQAWLVQLWDTGGDGISLTRQEAERMSNITPHSLSSGSARVALGRFQVLTPL